MEAASEGVYCKKYDGDRPGGVKKNYLYAAFICSEDNHVTIVASSNFLIKVPQFTSSPSKSHPYFILGVELPVGTINTPPLSSSFFYFS